MRMSSRRFPSGLHVRPAGARLSPVAFWAVSILLGAAGCSSGGSPNSPTANAPSSSFGGDPSAGSSSSAAPATGGSGGSSSSGSPVASTGSSSSGGGSTTIPPSGSGGGGASGSGGGGAGSSGSGGDAAAGGSSDSTSTGEDSGPSTGGLDGGAGGNGSVAATGCAGKTYKLCEDFETGTVGSLGPGWTKYAGYGTEGPTDVALANDAAHSGMQSLKSDSINKGQTRAQRSLASIGATASNHWGRIFYKVQEPSPKPQKTATNTVIHITWTSLVGPAGEDRVVDIVENMQGMHQWLFNIPSDGCCTSSAYNWTFDPPDGSSEWHCAEWWVDVATESYRFFSDSEEVTSLAFTGNAKSMMSAYTAVVVGATWYQQDGTILSPFVIWFDDLAIDDTRVGCQ